MKTTREKRSKVPADPLESLADISLGLSSFSRPSDFAENFARRAAELLNRRDAVLALAYGSGWKTLLLRGGVFADDPPLIARLNEALSGMEISGATTALVIPARELLHSGDADAMEWSQVLLARLINPQGKPLGVLCVGTEDRSFTEADIALMQRIGEHAAVGIENSFLFSRVSNATRHWAQIFDSIPDLVVVHDDHQQVVRVNRPLARVMGSEPSALIGKSMRRIMPGGEVASKPCAFCRGNRRDEDTIHFLRDRTYLVSSSNILSTPPAAPQTVHVLKDITERREAERRYRELFNNVQEGVFFCSVEGSLIEVNEALVRMLGYSSSEQLLKVNLFSGIFVLPELGLRLQQAMESRGMVKNQETLLRRREGSHLHTLLNAFAVREGSGNRAQYRGVILDITEARNFQAKLIQTEKLAAVGQLVSGVAHEVNNPLTAIMGFADLLLENSAHPPETQKRLQIIVQEAQRTKEIVQNLLSFARQRPPQTTAVRLNEIVRRTVALRSYDFSSHGVELIETLEESLPDVVGDSQQLQQVFLNILNNAYDAVLGHGKKGRIEINSSHADGFAEVSFRDNGPGVSNPERIFEPFFTTKEVGKGTGLGLSICYGIVKEHKGEILCHNHAQGAVFTVRLPVPVALPQARTQEVVIV